MNASLRALATLGVFASLAGCVPVVGVAGHSRDGRVFFSIFSCAVPWHDLPLDELSVRRADRTSPGSDHECRLVPTGYAKVLARWEYGTAPDGYRLTGDCRPLARGERYEVEVTAVGLGRRSFQLTDDGDLRWDTRFACW
jgi:hypothetical protein